MTTHPLLGARSHRPGPVLALGDGAELRLARLHEACGAARRTLALMLAWRIGLAPHRPLVWIAPDWSPETLQGDGIAPWIEPGHVLFITPGRIEDMLWTLEEVLRAGVAPLAVADLPELPSLTAVRRLHLAAGAGATDGLLAPLGLILTPGDGGAPGVETRWHMQTRHGAEAAHPTSGNGADTGMPPPWPGDGHCAPGTPTRGDAGPASGKLRGHASRGTGHEAPGAGHRPAAPPRATGPGQYIAPAMTGADPRACPYPRQAGHAQHPQGSAEPMPFPPQTAMPDRPAGPGQADGTLLQAEHQGPVPSGRHGDPAPRSAAPAQDPEEDEPLGRTYHVTGPEERAAWTSPPGRVAGGPPVLPDTAAAWHLERRKARTAPPRQWQVARQADQPGTGFELRPETTTPVA